MKLLNALVVIANLAIIGLFAYVVFGLQRSPWWMLFPVFIHFRMTRDK